MLILMLGASPTLPCIVNIFFKKMFTFMCFINLFYENFDAKFNSGLFDYLIFIFVFMFLKIKIKGNH